MAEKMTKNQMYQAMADKTGLSKKEVAAFMDSLVELALDQVRSAGEFTLPGLGKLVKKRREARMGRNPATGESIHIPAKTVVKFRVAKHAKEAVL